MELDTLIKKLVAFAEQLAFFFVTKSLTTKAGWQEHSRQI